MLLRVVRRVCVGAFKFLSCGTRKKKKIQIEEEEAIACFIMKCLLYTQNGNYSPNESDTHEWEDLQPNEEENDWKRRVCNQFSKSRNTKSNDSSSNIYQSQSICVDIINKFVSFVPRRSISCGWTSETLSAFDVHVCAFTSTLTH